MPLPQNFNESEHLQDLFRRYANRQIRDFFSDLGGEDFDVDITNARSSLRYGCTHKDDDSLLQTLLRWELFTHVRRLKYDVPFIGIPVSSFDAERKYKPQIVLFFQEDLGDIEPGYEVVTGRVSFRAMGYESDTFTPTVAQNFANKISTNFANAGGFVWRKGRLMCSYSDWPKGYQLQILSRTENDARTLADRVLDLQNDTFDASKFNVNQNQAEGTAFPPNPGTDFIYGDTRRKPRRRPVADVRFQYAVAHIHGLSNPIPLVDRSGIYPSALSS